MSKWLLFENEYEPMDKGTNRTYDEDETPSAYDGDPFAGIPVEKRLVEEVSAEFALDTVSLARALRDVERSPDPIDVSVLFSGYDPVPVGTDGDGHLYLLAEASVCWDVVEDRLTLTADGRKAVAEVHDRCVRKRGENIHLGDGVGFVVSRPEFPSRVISNVHTLLERTALSPRQATVWALNHHALSPSAIASVLGLSTPLIEAELIAISQEIQRSVTSLRTLDIASPTLSYTEVDPLSSNWMGLDWSAWLSLRDREQLLDQLPRDAGVYRVRHTGWPGLLYIGESGSEDGLRDRVGQGLASGLNANTRPCGGNHDATGPLWRIENAIEGSVEVSIATPPVAANKRYRRSLEAALIAVCRRETGRTPDVQLNRDPLPTSLEEARNSGEISPSTKVSLSAPSWRSWRTVTTDDWMGFNWTEPRPLARRDEIREVDTCLFRVWEPQEQKQEWDRTLSAIGTSETPISRLFNLLKKYGPDAIFSVTELTGLSTDSINRSRELKEARYDLVGAHYLATGDPPQDQ